MKRNQPFRRSWRRAASPLLAIVLFGLGFAVGSLARPHASQQSDATRDALLAPIWEALDLIETRYVDPVELEVLVDGALAGMVDALEDPHSAYIRPALYSQSVDFSGEFSGIGVMVKAATSGGRIEVVSVIAGSPADGVGVQPGDIFHAVNGELVDGYSLAELSAIVPGPPGTRVTVTFDRAGALLTLEIERGVFALPNVSHALVGDGIAHIKLQSFNDLTRTQLDAAFEALDAGSLNGMILDMRGNPGGALESAIEVSSAFIGDSLLLRQVARDGSEERTRAQGSRAAISAPIVVLVDAGSASATEVLAGAMQDHGVALALGEQTFGKGTVQRMPQLSNGGGIRLTTRRWLTPKGRSIHERGIRPDLVVEQDALADGQEDRQLEAAIAYLKSLRG